MDYGIQLGRRFRALKAWFVIRAFGREGLAARIREACRLARLVGGWVGADERFELLAPVEMGVVCFRARSFHFGAREDFPDEVSDEINERLLECVNATGETYLTHTRLHGRLALRIAVGNVLTTERHLSRAWQLVCRQLAVVCDAATPPAAQDESGMKSEQEEGPEASPSADS
jgi:aromatic-L-amino-acid decarboxylase